jgi:hypothetical protein
MLGAMGARALSSLATTIALAAPAAPIVTAIDGPSVGEYSSMKLNGGNPVVSYHDIGNGHLKVATCTAGCSGASPTWIVTTVDDSADVGTYTSLQLNDGNPVVAYFDVANKRLKLATCTAACATASPTWVLTVVDHTSVDVGRFPSLQLDNGKPVISYRDKANGDLKLATCTADCATDVANWVFNTVEAAGDTGRFTSMQLNAGRPVIAYFDYGLSQIKVATCLDRCATASPAWVVSVVDTVPNEVESLLSLQLDGGNPVVSYYEGIAQNLKLATCTAGCATAAPTWVIVTVDRVADAGQYSSLQLDAGRPVIAYSGAFFECFTAGRATDCTLGNDLRLAVCTADCRSATPTWSITTVDNDHLSGWDPSLQLLDGRALVSYYDISFERLKVASVGLAEAAIAPNFTAIWWNFEQSGWGINFAHQDDTVFGTLFTYDASGNPMWLVLSGGQKQTDGTFTGTLFRTTGPPFDANPFTPIGPSNVTTVGTMSVGFAGDTAFLRYSVDGIGVNKVIRRQVFGAHAAACRSVTASRTSLTNYTDLWWNPNESGWGINVAQQGDVIFATLFTYDAAGRGMWYVLSGAPRQSDGSFAGDLFRTTGPAFNAAPWTPIGASNVTRVGTMQLRFANGESGTLTYSVNGTTVQKSIVRQVFGTAVPACS